MDVFEDSKTVLLSIPINLKNQILTVLIANVFFLLNGFSRATRLHCIVHFIENSYISVAELGMPPRPVGTLS